MDATLQRFVALPGEESPIRKAAGALADGPVRGIPLIRVFMRGSSLFILTAGVADPLSALAKDALGKKLMDALAAHATFHPEHEEHHALALRRARGVFAELPAEASA